MSDVRHWLGANFVAGAPNGTDGVYPLTESGAPVGKYAGPGPAAPSDPHRCVRLLCRHYACLSLSYTRCALRL